MVFKPSRGSEPPGPKATTLGIVVGLEQEAVIAARWGTVAIGGGTFEGASRAAEVLAGQGVRALLSFGIAGALDPALRPGTLLAASEIMVDGQVLPARLIPTGVQQARLLGARQIAQSAAEKAALFASTGAAAVDMESGAMALVANRHALPFGAIRAICDPADTSLPPAATAALEDGSIRFSRVLWSLARRPWQLRSLLRLSRDARRAQLALQSVHLTGLA